MNNEQIKKTIQESISSGFNAMFEMEVLKIIGEALREQSDKRPANVDLKYFCDRFEDGLIEEFPMEGC